MNFEQDVIDRLARLETKQDAIDAKLEIHLVRHWETSIKILFVFLGTLTSIIIAIFK